MNVYSKRPVNFDYIDFLCDMLRLGDLLLEITRRGLGIQSKEPRPRRKSKSLEHFLKLHGEGLEHLFRTLCLFVTYYVVEEIRKPLPPNLQDLLNLSPQQLRRFVGNGMLMFALWQLGENREKEKVNREQRNREIGALREKLINELPIRRGLVDRANNQILGVRLFCLRFQNTSEKQQTHLSTALHWH